MGQAQEDCADSVDESILKGLERGVDRGPARPFASLRVTENVGQAAAARRPYLRWRPAGEGGNE